MWDTARVFLAPQGGSVHETLASDRTDFRLCHSLLADLGHATLPFGASVCSSVKWHCRSRPLTAVVRMTVSFSGCG